ncbi:MAG TPA: glycoside hydrolase family 2 TIM barrel-domain containing protein [Oscillospiraceae bacterium]|nr:glycoside hydrolase family 2 TIM barrel-domain containing protein [Oscillospiraceae bacterium]
MLSPWGETFDKEHPLPEYPRPQMRRESWLNLNGPWDYAITDGDGDRAPETYDGTIIVPYSPECVLSGVLKTLRPEETLWYRRKVSLPEGFAQAHTLLHFGAVDQIAEVFWNGEKVCSHSGGYAAFSAEVKPLAEGDNELVVKVRDFTEENAFPRGKQKTDRGGIWYTAQSGIWQTVWMESVPQVYIHDLKITPLFDEAAVKIKVLSQEGYSCTLELAGNRYGFTTNRSAKIPLADFIPWSPENPHLYEFTVELGDDKVESYFGMRKFSVEKGPRGVKQLFLNGKPYFHNGVLDQGYHCDGLYTPASDEAMIHDIETMKALGFNMLRKHIKVEPLRWYYHCDRLGMLVWQDMPCGGGKHDFLVASSPMFTGIHFDDGNYVLFHRENEEGRLEYYHELTEMIRELYNCTCIALWVPFNEGWGQFDAKRAAMLIESLDPTRTIDHASGWHDQKIGEVRSFHVYFFPYLFKKDPLGRAVALSEFGGYNCRIDGHCFNEQDYGYRKMASPAELYRSFKKLYEDQVIPAKKRGLSAAVYTQLCDVEDELNGLMTYDRKVLKLPAGAIRKINEKLMG